MLCLHGPAGVKVSDAELGVPRHKGFVSNKNGIAKCQVFIGGKFNSIEPEIHLVSSL